MSANYHIDCGSTAIFVPSISAVTLSGAVGTVGQWVDLSNSDSFCNVSINVGACSGPLTFAVQTAPGQWDYVGGVLGSGAFSGVIFSGGSPASGQFTDPTSGLTSSGGQLPTWFNSGGLLLVNSGLWVLPGAAGAPGSGTTSGMTFAPLLQNGYPAGTLPFGTNPIQHGQGGFGVPTLNGNSGGAPIFCSGGIAYAAFQRNYQYARIVLISGATVPPFVQAGFFAQLNTTGSGGYSWQPQAGAGVLV